MNSVQKKLTEWQRLPFVGQLTKTFPAGEIFLVGGAVRDLLLNRETKDYDLVIRNVARGQLETALQKLGKVNLVGKRFGVFKFRPKGWNGEDIDIALPRTEHTISGTGAYKDFQIKSNAQLPILDDLSRRDFTINAMALAISGSKNATKAFVDPFGGAKDLKAKKIRTVGDPAIRFREDYSRLLRAIRFAVQLNFTIEPKTSQALRTRIRNLNKQVDGQRIVPHEVIAKEITKTLLADPVRAIQELDRYDVLRQLMPELYKMAGCPQPEQWHKEGDVWTHTLLALQTLRTPKFKKEFNDSPVPAEVIWAIIFHDLGKPYTLKTVKGRLRTDGHDIVSAKKFRHIAERLRLAAAGINVDAVQTIIAKHMLLVGQNAMLMKATTVEKYFFNDDFPGQELLMLMYADVSASLQKGNTPDYTNYNVLKQRLRAMRRGPKVKTLPKPLVDGHLLMKQLRLKPGKQIGLLLTAIREGQLNGTITTKAQALAEARKRL